MPDETLTSLLLREVTIAASGAGKLSRALWEVSRVLREHLRVDAKYDKMAINKGRSGAETDETPVESRSQPSLDFGSGNERDYD
jgi:hypothetical protein